MSCTLPDTLTLAWLLLPAVGADEHSCQNAGDGHQIAWRGPTGTVIGWLERVVVCACAGKVFDRMSKGVREAPGKALIGELAAASGDRPEGAFGATPLLHEPHHPSGMSCIIFSVPRYDPCSPGTGAMPHGG